MKKFTVDERIIISLCRYIDDRIDWIRNNKSKDRCIELMPNLIDIIYDYLDRVESAKIGNMNYSAIINNTSLCYREIKKSLSKEKSMWDDFYYEYDCNRIGIFGYKPVGEYLKSQGFNIYK